jgi:hypothetical protein
VPSVLGVPVAGGCPASPSAGPVGLGEVDGSSDGGALVAGPEGTASGAGALRSPVMLMVRVPVEVKVVPP